MERIQPMKKTRRTFTGEQKVKILRSHLIDHVPVSDLCDQHGLQPAMFYQWQKAFFENGAAAFEVRRGRPAAASKDQERIAALESKLQMRNEALAELMQEHVVLKKELGEL